MRVAVCWKQVVDTAARLTVRDGSLAPHAPGVLPVVNPYDEFALEMALQVREAAGGEVVLVTLSDDPSEDVLFHGLAMGADRALVVRLPRGARPDALAAAGLLAPALRELAPDVVFCGARAVDDGAAAVGPALAETLALPHVGRVTSVAPSPAPPACALRARAREGDAVAVYDVPLPALLTFVRGPALPRYPSLDGIFGAGAKPCDERPAPWCAETDGTVRTALHAPREDRRGEIVGGDDLAAAVDALLDRVVRATDVLT